MLPGDATEERFCKNRQQKRSPEQLRRQMSYRMDANRFVYGITAIILALIFYPNVQLGLVRAANSGDEEPQPPAARQQDDSGLTIVTESPLPDVSALGHYEVHLLARGGPPPYHWHLEKGALPPGLQLQPDGRIYGEVRSGGEYRFTLSVHDAGNQHTQKEFVVRVHSALELKWKTMAHVDGTRIDGSVDVSNATHDDMDLTFIVLAVAPNGRATAIGYQHFTLRKGTIGEELPFGDTIAHGTYVVYVDAVGEVIQKKVIYREQLQTHSLDVTVGP